MVTNVAQFRHRRWPSGQLARPTWTVVDDVVLLRVVAAHLEDHLHVVRGAAAADASQRVTPCRRRCSEKQDQIRRKTTGPRSVDGHRPMSLSKSGSKYKSHTAHGDVSHTKQVFLEVVIKPPLYIGILSDTWWHKRQVTVWENRHTVALKEPFWNPACRNTGRNEYCADWCVISASRERQLN